MSLNEKAIDYSMLVEEAESNQRVYNMLLKQSKEISLTSVLESSNVRIVDKADIPRSPFKPKVLDSILLSVVFGIFIGTGLVFFFEYMDNSVKTLEDVRKLIGMAALTSIPYDKTLKRSKTKALEYVESNNNQQKKIGSYYSPYDSKNYFLAGLKVMQQRNPGISFLMQSAISGEGKTTALVKSSLDLAQGGLNVLVVDADLARSDLNKALGFNANGSGLLTAMTSVLSQKIYHGNLQDYSVSDLFSIISFKKQSGQLVVSNDSFGMIMIFNKGRLSHIQSKEKNLSNSLGTMLLRSGLINESQLSDALERNKRTGQSLGHILINCGYVKQEQLRGHLKLQAEENLQRLFSWNCGSFRFDLGHVESNEDDRVYLEDDYASIINQLESKAVSRFLKKVLLSNINQDIKPNLSLLSTGKSPTISDTVYFAILEKFLIILKQNFDVVFVDSCPVIDGGGASPLTAMVDGVIFVIKQGCVSVKTINEAHASLKNAHANIIGAILNQVKKGPTKQSMY